MKKKRNLRWISDFLAKINQPTFNRIAAIIGVISGVLTILQFLKSLDFPEWLDFAFLQSIVNFYNSYPTISWIVVMGLWGAFLLVMVIKYRSSAILKMNASTINMAEVISISKEAFNNINSIDMNKKTNECNITTPKECKELQDAHEDIIKSNRRNLNYIFLNYTTSFLDKIKEIIEIYVGREVSTCFKMCVEYTEPNSDITTKGTVTLARDTVSDAERDTRGVEKVVPLEENSDFYEIVNGKNVSPSRTYFYQGDLKKYSEKLSAISDGRIQYRNSNRDWSKHYLATIVVPVKNIIITDSEKKYEILGFLCVDSMSTTAFSEKQKVINIRLLQCFADVFSVVLKAYKDKLQ